jgi:cysteine-rich repeat protein
MQPLARSVSRVVRLAALVALTGAPACVNNFDASLYQARERDAGDARVADAGADTGADDAGSDAGMDAGLDMGMDAGTDANVDAGSDAGPLDAGPDVGTDAGPPPIGLADYCASPGSVPLIMRPTDPMTAVSQAYLVDTRSLVDDVSSVVACTGSTELGNDGFLGITMNAGEHWHFHLRRPTNLADAALYVLDSACDERTCSSGQGQDLCGAGADEHFTFVAPSTGEYFVTADSRAAGGFLAELDIIHPVCGDGTRQHSEGCDDHNMTAGDGCDAACRLEIASGASETEANDDPYSANHLVLAAAGASTVLGHVTSACESDAFAVDVPTGMTGRFTVHLSLASGACPADATTPMELVFLDRTGTITLASATLGAGGGCLDLGGATLMGLPAGTYFVRLRSINTSFDRPLDYLLTITPTFT